LRRITQDLREENTLSVLGEKDGKLVSLTCSETKRWGEKLVCGKVVEHDQ
jgi:hypothetical protein